MKSKWFIKSYSIAFICVTEFHYESSFMRFLNSIIKPDTVMSVGVVHPDPAAESLLAPRWVLCCVFTSVLLSTHQSAPTGKCNFHVCQWADVALPINCLLNTFNWATRPAHRRIQSERDAEDYIILQHNYVQSGILDEAQWLKTNIIVI